MNENEAKALFRQAADVYKDGDYKDALKIFDRLDAAFPKNVRIMYPRARCFAKLGRLTEAVALCEVLIKNYGHESAAELKAQLQPGMPANTAMPFEFEDTAFDPLDITVDEKLASAFERPPAPARTTNVPSPKVIGAVVGGIAVVLLLVYAVFGSKDVSPTDTVASSSTPSVVDAPAATTDAMAPIDTSVAPELVRIERHDSTDGVTVNASIEFGVWTNCGSYEAFLENYAACKPAAIRFMAMGTIIMEYRILGERDGACAIEVTAVQMPMYESWNSTSMICPCDTSIDFVTLTEQLSIMGILDGTLACDGPLFDAMKQSMDKYQQP